MKKWDKFQFFWLSFNIYFCIYFQGQLGLHRFVSNLYFHQLTEHAEDTLCLGKLQLANVVSDINVYFHPSRIDL